MKNFSSPQSVTIQLQDKTQIVNSKIGKGT